MQLNFERAVIWRRVRQLRFLGPGLPKAPSYVTADKIYCVYIAPDEAAAPEHALRGGFPANRISEVKSMIDPTTGGK
jgi:Nickel responsive protein SCO4226-like